MKQCARHRSFFDVFPENDAEKDCCGHLKASTYL